MPLNKRRLRGWRLHQAIVSEQMGTTPKEQALKYGS